MADIYKQELPDPRLEPKGEAGDPGGRGGGEDGLRRQEVQSVGQRCQSPIRGPTIGLSRCRISNTWTPEATQ